MPPVSASRGSALQFWPSHNTEDASAAAAAPLLAASQNVSQEQKRQEWWEKQVASLTQGLEPGRRVHCELRLKRSNKAANNNSNSNSDLTASSPASSSPRYSLTVVDSLSSGHKSVRTPTKIGILIIPQGRECEWLFTSAKGQHQVLKDSQFHRLIFVAMNRHQVYASIDQVKRELSPLMHELTTIEGHSKQLPPQQHAKCPNPIPFLSVSNGESVGERWLRHECESECNGPIVVEDVRVELQDEHCMRRLIFTRTSIIQSEAKLLYSSRDDMSQQSKVGSEVVSCVDPYQLPLAYQQCMLASLAFFTSAEPQHALLLGVGSGLMPAFMSRCLPQCNIECCELDAQVLDIARRLFDFEFVERQAGNVNSRVGDGLALVKQRANAIRQAATAANSSNATTDSSDSTQLVDCLLIDCNSTDLSQGLSFPPASFLTDSALSDAHTLLSPNGIVIYNFGCRDEELRLELLARMRRHFAAVFLLQVDEEEDVNCIVVCCKHSSAQSIDSAKLQSQVLTPERVKDKYAIAQLETPFKWSTEDLDFAQCLQGSVQRCIPDAQGSCTLQSIDTPLTSQGNDAGSEAALAKKRAQAKAKRLRQAAKKKQQTEAGDDAQAAAADSQ